MMMVMLVLQAPASRASASDCDSTLDNHKISYASNTFHRSAAPPATALPPALLCVLAAAQVQVV